MLPSRSYLFRVLLFACFQFWSATKCDLKRLKAFGKPDISDYAFSNVEEVRKYGNNVRSWRSSCQTAWDEIDRLHNRLAAQEAVSGSGQKQGDMIKR